MKVLMLGWEFPPHISGGLGTACFGMTEALAAKGVEVTFVVPRAYGDEDARFVRVVGCNDVAAALRAEGGAGDPTRLEGMAAELYAVESDDPGVHRLVEVDSLLTPYLNEEEYRRRLAKEQGMRSDLLSVPGTTMSEIRQILAMHSTDLTGARRARRFIESFAPSAFTGRYGPDLMSEVARYAVVVGEAAMNEDFDVIHAHDWLTYPAGIVAAAVSGRPLVVHVHATEVNRSPEGGANPQVREIEKLGLDAADRILAVSDFLGRILVDEYAADPAKIRTAHNGFLPFDGAEAAVNRRTIHDPIVLLLGRVTFQKGPEYFLRAAARVVKAIPNAQFVIAGSGDMLSYIVELSAELGIARNVHFTGFLRGDAVREMYDQADVYVMPSVSEPFGIAPLEAMSLGTPVIISKQSGVAEVVSGALTIDFWDVEAMADKIIAVLQQPALRKQLVETAHRDLSRLSWAEMVDTLIDVYTEVLS